MEPQPAPFRYLRSAWRRPPARLLHAELLLRLFDDRIEGFETHVRACQTLSEGHYRLTLELLIAEDEETYVHSRSSFVDASIVEADGLRYWKIERVEPFE